MRVLRASPFAEVLTPETKILTSYNMHHAGYRIRRGVRDRTPFSEVEEMEYTANLLEKCTGNPIPDEWRNWGRAGGSSGSELEAIEEFEGESDEEEAEVGGGPSPIIGASRRGFESVAIKLAVARGNRDENKLTNMVFFGRHPERNGKAIAKSEPNFQALSREWVDIRDRLVRPALRAPGGAAPAPSRQGAKCVEEQNCVPVGCTERATPELERMKALVSFLKKYGSDLPIDFLLGWIYVESGGCVAVVTKYCERGYFQVHPGEACDIGADPQRLSTDREYSVQKGIEMVRRKMIRARNLGFVPGTDLFWHVTKLLHWLPGGVNAIIQSMKARGGLPKTWQEFSKFVEENRIEIIRILARSVNKPWLVDAILAELPGRHGWDPIKGVKNATKAVEKGRLWAELLRKAGVLSELSDGGLFEEAEIGPGLEEAELTEQPRFSPSVFPKDVLRMLGRGLEAAAIKLAISFGHRDENQLTNLIFFARHPERNGQRITRGEPRFSELSREWLDIRDRLVGPALRKPSSPPATSQPSEPRPAPSGGACRFGFTPRAVESPGGGRVTKKTPPNRADLVNIQGVAGPIPLHPLAAAAWKALVAGARGDGIQHPLLLPTSGFRDPELQRRLWVQARTRYGSAREARKWVAPPGSSAHQSGRAIDFYLGDKNSSANVARLRRLPAYQWLVQNAVCFGFYPYEAEPWHWEYNPPKEERLVRPTLRNAPPPRAGAAPKSHPVSPGAITAAPVLIKHEDQPPASTLYVNIPLGSESPARPMTGIFIPENYVPRPQVDLILYLHGHKTTRVCGPGDSASIDGYWRSRYWPLREEINRSGKNIILVAPTLGPKSEPGRLTDPRRFEAYLDQVLAALTEYGSYQKAGRSPTFGNIILACHSGGGLPMRRLALGSHRYADNIRECWGFDSLYDTVDPELWARWARSRPDARLFIYYLASTEKLSKKLKDKQLPNVSVERSTARSAPGHCWVPIEHWRHRIQAGGFLLDR
jgi:hypothetical protein